MKSLRLKKKKMIPLWRILFYLIPQTRTDIKYTDDSYIDGGVLTWVN